MHTLESLGQLSAGIAHEINTPLQYISDHAHFLQEAFLAQAALLDAYAAALSEPAGEHPEALRQRLKQLESEHDAAYFAENVPRAITRVIEGVARVTRIVGALKAFSRADGERTLVDLNRSLESALAIAHHETKYVADVQMELGELSPVFCQVGDLGQVFLNLIVNAAHAIGDRVASTGDKGTITVSTRQEGGLALVTIADTGGGIPEEIRARVFDPFFTTKAVGKGTGQGLAIARSIAEKYSGSLSFVSEPGRGTVFTLSLPIARPSEEMQEAQ